VVDGEPTYAVLVDMVAVAKETSYAADQDGALALLGATMKRARGRLPTGAKLRGYVEQVDAEAVEGARGMTAPYALKFYVDWSDMFGRLNQMLIGCVTSSITSSVAERRRCRTLRTLGEQERKRE